MTQRWAMRCVLGTTSPATKTRVRACAEREGPLLRVWRRARRSEARRGTTDVTVDGGALQGAADKACEGAEGEMWRAHRVGGRPWKRRSKNRRNLTSEFEGFLRYELRFSGECLRLGSALHIWLMYVRRSHSQ